MAISKIDTYNFVDFVATAGAPTISDNDLRISQGEAVASPNYLMKNTGARLKIRVNLGTLSGLAIAVQGRMGPGDDFISATTTGSGGRLTVEPENVFPEMRIVLIRTDPGQGVYVQTGPFYIGEV